MNAVIRVDAVVSYMGVDPGLSGAIAIFTPDPLNIVVFDMPVFKITVGKSAKRKIDLYGLAHIIDHYSGGVKSATIEEVSSSPQMGVVSAFTFGYASGAVQSAIAANFIPMNLVTPAKWKRDLKLSSDKDASRRLASQLFPTFSKLWSRAMDDGRAEAVLLAYYGSAK